jgi:hypothetical protein
MTTRTATTIATFRRPFLVNGAEHASPAGDYQVVTEEELIEGLSFLAYRRVMTAIFLPGAERGSWEMHVIDPEDLAAAQERDREASLLKLRRGVGGQGVHFCVGMCYEHSPVYSLT